MVRSGHAAILLSLVRIWVDMTAAAHPLVLRPIIEGLTARGHTVEVTARDYGQTLGVLERLGIAHEVVGRHAGASTPRKATALARRSGSLARWARGRGLDLALGHGSVDLAVVGTMLRVPSVQMQDYEHAGLQRQLAFRAARRVLAPDAIPVEAMRRAGARPQKLFRYPGLKEDYYLADFEPDRSVLDELGLDPARVLAVVRPPPETSTYHERNPLYERVLERLATDAGTTAVVIPRTEEQRRSARAKQDPSIVVPERAIDAQSLIALADLVAGAGGTMNREAAALGTPAYTIFSGRMGAVDEALIAAGRLLPLDDPGQLELRKRQTEPGPRDPRDAGLLVEGVLGAVD
jgi:predicted glycosyltransferase